MTRITRLKVVATVTAVLALAFAGAPAFAAPATAYTCTGGDIPSGTYSSLTVSGVCAVPADAVVTVTGNLNVTGGAILDAASAPSTITVGGNVTVGPGAIVDVGCTFAHGGCASGPEGDGPYAGQQSTVLVKGNVTVNGAYAPLNGITVVGNVAVNGGPADVPPWAIKDNTIRGNLTVAGLTAEWFGILRNSVGGNATLSRITMTGANDAPGSSGINPVFIVSNTVTGNLSCNGLTPGISIGFSGVDENHVGGRSVGQCAGVGAN